MKPTVYVTMPLPADVQDFLKEHCTVKQWSGEEPIKRDALIEELEDVQGLLTSGYKIDEELLSKAPRLKVVSNMSVGYNNFQLDDMKKHGVIGTHTPYVLDATVADLAFALILSVARRIPEMNQLVKTGNWKRTKDDTPFFGQDVHGKTLGIIGMGRIGEAIAQRGRFGFDMDILYHNRNRKQAAEEKYRAVYCELEDLLKRSDFVVLVTPLTPETRHLMGEKEFRLMKKSAFFINVSRGLTVDEEALISALQNKEIKGAGLDVFQKEPVDKENPLLTMDNVVALPHIGSATERTRDAMAMRAAENIVAVLTGKEAIDPVVN